MSDPILFALSLMNTAGLLFISIYYMVAISDLECDYLNAQQCCSKLNFWVKPKIVAHGIMFICILIYGYWVLALITFLPLLHMFYQLYKVPSGNIGVYEPTEIYFHGKTKQFMRDIMIFLGYYLVLFFAYLYCMITAIIKENPLPSDNDNQIEF